MAGSVRKLQRYSVNVSDWHFQQLVEDSQIEEIHPGIWAQMAGTTIYDPVLGLALETDAPSCQVECHCSHINGHFKDINIQMGLWEDI